MADRAVLIVRSKIAGLRREETRPLGELLLGGNEHAAAGARDDLVAVE